MGCAAAADAVDAAAKAAAAAAGNAEVGVSSTVLVTVLAKQSITGSSLAEYRVAV